MILDAFKEEMNQLIDIQSMQRNTDDPTGRTTEILVTTKSSIPAGYYVGSSAEALISERFKTVVDGVLIIDPIALSGYSIVPSDIITLNSREYSIVLSDDVMLQGEVLVIGVKRK